MRVCVRFGGSVCRLAVVAFISIDFHSVGASYFCLELFSSVLYLHTFVVAIVPYSMFLFFFAFFCASF